MPIVHHNPSFAERLQAARTVSILVIDESSDDRDEFASLLEGRIPNAHVVAVDSAEGARGLLASGRIDVVICDAGIEIEKGKRFLSEVRRRVPRARRILIVDYSDVDEAMRTMREGVAEKFLLRPMDADQLVAAIQELRRY